jgi:protein SCO1
MLVRVTLVFLLSWSSWAASNATSGALNQLPSLVRDIGFDQKLGARAPLDERFVDENGKSGKLSEWMHGPAILALVYYGCPNLCQLSLEGLFRGLSELSKTAGKDFSVLAVSIDPTEKPALASEKRHAYLVKYHRAGSGEGIHFFTGDKSSIERLAKGVGFRYTYDARSNQYAHPAGVIVLTEEGRISRYLYGIEYAGKDLRLALLDASNLKIGTLVDRFLLFCYHYDAQIGGYSFWIWRLIRISAAAMVLIVATSIGVMLLNERRLKRAGV